MINNNIVAFEKPLIINLNKFLESNETSYTLRVVDYPSYNDEVIKIYKSDENENENIIILKDCYSEYTIEIDPEKVNILVVATSYEPYSEISNIEDIYIQTYQLFKFDTFPENSPIVIAEPEFTFNKGYTCYCEDENHSDECECSEDYIGIYHTIINYELKNNNPDIEKILNSKNIIYFTTNNDYFFILTEQGIHTGDERYYITQKLAQKINKKEIDGDSKYIQEKIYIGKNIYIIIYYNYNDIYVPPIRFTFVVGHSKIYLSEKVIILYFSRFINKNLLKDIIRYLDLIEQSTQDKNIGFYGHCNLESKELLKYIPNNLLKTVKISTISSGDLQILRKIDVKEIDELNINLKRERDNSVVKCANKLTLSIAINKPGFDGTYIIKIIGSNLVKNFIDYLTKSEIPINLYEDLSEKKKFYIKFLNLV